MRLINDYNFLSQSKLIGVIPLIDPLDRLIANQSAAKSQVGVDYRGKNTVKSVQDEKYSAKSADFLRFLLYLCHVIDDFK